MTNMTPNDARERADRLIELIASNRDAEAAYSEEHAFFEDVLRAVATTYDPWTRMMIEQALRVADTAGDRR